jgi:hypothetical protein
MKQTAVEFIVMQLDFLNRERKENLIDAETYFKHKISLIEQAKEMEKQQIERMYSDAIEFAEWIRIKDFQTATGNKWIGLNMEYYTTQELYEQFKKK